MLPIRLGMVNADGPQELSSTRSPARAGWRPPTTAPSACPRTPRSPSSSRTSSASFYKAMFAEQVKRRTCAPSSSNTPGTWAGATRAPPTRSPRDELRAARRLLGAAAGRPCAGAQNVFLTRLHLRYDAAHFPEDLVFQETADRENFQGRYILRHPWTGERPLRGGAALPPGAAEARTSRRPRPSPPSPAGTSTRSAAR